ncbi:MAG: DNA mismatch repair endonuclease MutL [Bdellovibrionales bacterium]|nr:DNA mismatch repair endonuclease MutL [Bdellovibrionales bacterium]
MPIQQLSPEVINQIAAGEVIERPANLLKELIENSLDAGATQISVEADDGGRTLLVRDNGCGFERKDLDIVLHRHATSKIHQANDLWSLSSYGFRGEALSSISAVSEFELTTRTHTQETGYRLGARFGQRFDIDQVSHAPGTQIRISQLFENVPARLKFLRSGPAELTQIRKVLKAFGLSHPEIDLSYTEKKSLAFHWPNVATLKARAEQVLGLTPLFETTGGLDDVSVAIAFGSPSLIQGNSQNIWIYVQDRWIQDRSLQQAVLESYRGLLMHGEFPIAVVRIQVPPDSVDINVHPAKSQVKFQDPSKIFRAVLHTLRPALELTPWAPRATHSARPTESAAANAYMSPTIQTSFAQEPAFQQTALKTNSVNYEKAFPRAIPNHAKAHDPGAARESSQSKMENSATESMQSLTAAEYSSPSNSQHTSETAPTTANQNTFWQHLHIVGQVHQTYLIVQSPTAMYMIDQHAAHERILFERLMHQRKTRTLQRQPFLFPIEVNLTAPEAEHVWEQKTNIESLGMKLDRRSDTTLLIEEGASEISEASLVSVIKALAAQLLTETRDFAFEDKMQNYIATMACHSAIRAGQALSTPEIHSLLKQMDEFPLSGYCPHGRPSFIEMTIADIETKFGRRG